jgi:hypothetical protein
MDILPASRKFITKSTPEMAREIALLKKDF